VGLDGRETRTAIREFSFERRSSNFYRPRGAKKREEVTARSKAANVANEMFTSRVFNLPQQMSRAIAPGNRSLDRWSADQ
jgi:hypothetical protein